MTIEAVASYAFAGDRADWIAIHKSGDEKGRGGRRGGPGGGTGPAGPDDQKDEHPGNGSDLLLRRLENGSTLVIGHVTEYGFDESGRFLAWCLAPRRRDRRRRPRARPRDRSGAHPRQRRPSLLRPALARARRRARLPRGSSRRRLEAGPLHAVGLLRVRRRRAARGALGSGVGADLPRRDGHPPQRAAVLAGGPLGHRVRSAPARGGGERRGRVERRATDARRPRRATTRRRAETPPSADAPPTRRTRRNRPNDKPETAGLVIWHWLDQRLPTQQRVEEQRDRDRSFLAVLRVPERAFARLADDDLPEVTLGEDDRFAIGLDRRRYELDGTLDGRRFQDVWAIDPRTGERFLVAEKLRWFFGANPQGDRVLFYRDRAFWSYDLAAREARNLTAGLPTTFVDEESDVNVIDPPVTPPGWSEDGESVLLADNWDVWRVPVAGGDGGDRHAHHSGRQGARHPLPPRVPSRSRGRGTRPDRAALPDRLRRARQEGRAGAPAPRRRPHRSAALGGRRVPAPGQGRAGAGAGVLQGERARLSRSVGHRSRPPRRAAPDQRRRAARGPVVDAGPHAGRLQVRQGRAAPSIAPASRRLREGPPLSHHRLHLRADEPVPQPLLSARAVGIQRRRLHQQRLRGAAARHPVPHQRSGDVGGVVRAAGARGGGPHRRRRSRARRAARSFVGRLPDRVPGHPDRQVQRRRRRRAAHRSGQHVQLDLLEHRARPTSPSSRAARAASPATSSTNPTPICATRRSSRRARSPLRS